MKDEREGNKPEDGADQEPRYKQGIEEGKRIMMDCMVAAHGVAKDLIHDQSTGDETISRTADGKPVLEKTISLAADGKPVLPAAAVAILDPPVISIAVALFNAIMIVERAARSPRPPSFDSLPPGLAQVMESLLVIPPGSQN